MDVSTITMNASEAKAKLHAYKKNIAKMRHKSLSRELEREYEAAIKGYTALSKGTVCLDINQAIEEGGTDLSGLPRLAICRSDLRIVQFSWSTWTGPHLITFKDVDYDSTSRPMANRRVQVNFTPSFYNPNIKDQSSVHRYAKVPLVPADILPRRPGIEKFHTLFEVEKWEKNVRDVDPNRDPYLLRHLGGSLYAVIAEWELTDLEVSIQRSFIRR